MLNVQLVAHHVFAKGGLPIVGIASAKTCEALDTTVSKSEATQLLLQVQIVQQVMLLLLMLLLLLLLLNVAQVLEDLFCVLLVGIVGTAEEIRQLGGCETSGLVTLQITVHNTIQFVVTVRIERAVREETAVVIENAQFGESRRGVVHETAADLAETIWRRLLLLFVGRRSRNGRGRG